MARRGGCSEEAGTHAGAQLVSWQQPWCCCDSGRRLFSWMNARPCSKVLNLPKPNCCVQAITYNNLGCLFKRRNMPQLALQVHPRTSVLVAVGRGVRL